MAAILSKGSDHTVGSAVSVVPLHSRVHASVSQTDFPWYGAWGQGPDLLSTFLKFQPGDEPHHANEFCALSGHGVLAGGCLEGFGPIKTIQFKLLVLAFNPLEIY